MQQFNTFKLWNELLKNLSLPERDKQIIVTETLKQMKKAKFSILSFHPEFHLFLCKSVSSTTSSLKQLG